MGHVVTFALPIFEGKLKKTYDSVFMKQSNIFVQDKCEITVDKILYSEHELDLHNLRKSKSVTLCPTLPYSKYM